VGPLNGRERCVIRVQESMCCQDHAKCGVTVGRVASVGHKLSCGYVCAGWPAWAFAAESRGWSVLVIVLRECLWEKRIRGAFPDAAIIKGDELQSLGCHMTVDAWFCDVKPPQGMKIFGDVLSSQVMIFSSHRFRQLCPSSHGYQKLVMIHSECGGVTDGK
jgi:hypothetical protein